MKLIRLHSIIVGVTLTLSIFAGETFKLAGVFANNMVLQRGREVPIWGWAEPDEKITLEFAGQTVSANANEYGKWQIRLKPMEMSDKGRVLTVQNSSGKKVAVSNVLVGDVWLCSGQSNMAFSMGGCNAPEDISGADFPLIRQGVVDNWAAREPMEDGRGHWSVCSPQTANGFSAAAFYFARKVHQETGVPIGLLVQSVGGTRIELWLSQEGLQSVPELAPVRAELKKNLDEYQREHDRIAAQIEEWIPNAQKALAAGETPPQTPQFPKHPIANFRGGPFGIHCWFNAKIAPVAPYAIKGMLWYQGENGSSRYYHMMVALIQGWRKLWGQGDFPCYFVQIPNWQSSNPADNIAWSNVRQAQLEAFMKIPETGMAVSIDVGDLKDLHPKNKKDVGERLARWALHRDYGRIDVVPSGPIFRKMAIENGSIRLAFDHSGSGLIFGRKDGLAPVVAVDEPARCFEIAGADKNWKPANVKIDGNTVIVWNPEVPQPVMARYAYGMNPQAPFLYNREGLPGSPFTAEQSAH